MYLTIIVILCALILLFTGVVIYFFNLAFARKFSVSAADMDENLGKELTPFADVIGKGREFINQTPHEWCYTTSFDGLKLAARYYDNNSTCTILLFHGYRSSAAHDFSCAVEMYYKMGFNILMPDQRAHGKSEGHTISFGIKERYDCLSWAEYAAERFGGNVPIILAGVSMGAATVLMAAALPLPKNVIAIVADSSYSSPAAIIKRVTANRGYPVSLAFPVIRLGALLFGGFRLLEADPVRAVKEAKVPILLIHGEADHFVPPSMSEEIARANESIAFYTFPDASHGASYLIDRERYTQITADFIEKPLADFYKHLAQDIDLK